MGRGKKNKSLHPVDAYRRKQAKRTIKKSKDQRNEMRFEALTRKDPNTIGEEIKKILRLEQTGQATPKHLQQKVKLIRAHKLAVKHKTDLRQRAKDLKPDNITVKGLGRIVRKAKPIGTFDDAKPEEKESLEEIVITPQVPREVIDVDKAPLFPPGLTIPPHLEKPTGLKKKEEVKQQPFLQQPQPQQQPQQPLRQQQQIAPSPMRPPRRPMADQFDPLNPEGQFYLSGPNKPTKQPRPQHPPPDQPEVLQNEPLLGPIAPKIESAEPKQPKISEEMASLVPSSLLIRKRPSPLKRKKKQIRKVDLAPKVLMESEQAKMEKSADSYDDFMAQIAQIEAK